MEAHNTATSTRSRPEAVPQEILDFYLAPGAMTSTDGHASLFEVLPHDMAGLVRVVQGLLLHEHFAPAYGIALSAERRGESQLRSVPQMLNRLLARDGRPLSAARPLDARLVGVCRHFTVLLVAMLRARRVPARARCGFGTYFNAGRFEDHWVCEYWNAAQRRWILVDAQLDALQREKLKIDFDTLDVPRDRFVVAGEGWAQCRAGTVDPSAFGIFDIRGLWFVAGNVVRDAAALNNMELLPWDIWGAMLRPGEEPQDGQAAFLDRLAELTRSPDLGFAELRKLYDDPRLQVPPVVFNALLNRPESI